VAEEEIVEDILKKAVILPLPLEPVIKAPKLGNDPEFLEYSQCLPLITEGEKAISTVKESVPKLAAEPEKLTAEEELEETKAPRKVVANEIELETVPVKPLPVTSVQLVPEPG
jgi:hypothetical protein